MRLPAYQFLSFIGIGSLIALTGLRQFFIEPLENPLPNAVWFVLQISPLLVVVPGILRGRPRTFMICSLAGMLYFCHGVLVAVKDAQQTLGLWEVAFAVGLIAITSFAVWRGPKADQGVNE